MDTFLRFFGPTIKSFIFCVRPGSKFSFIINLELQGHLDDYSDVLGDCWNNCSFVFVCVLVRMLLFLDKNFHI